MFILLPNSNWLSYFLACITAELSVLSHIDGFVQGIVLTGK